MMQALLQDLRSAHGIGALAEWLETTFERAYDRLTVGQPPCPADLIFVLAGRPERKRYGWSLYRRGLAPTLLLSVDRSEARFLKVRAGLPEDGNIIRLLPIRPEQGNHLFLWAESDHVRSEVVRLSELNTFGEIAALAMIIRQRGFHHILIVSSKAHLRRIRYAAHQLLEATKVRITYVGVPQDTSSLSRQSWWSERPDIWLVLTECLKLAGYHMKYGICRWHARYGGRQQALPRPLN